MDPETQKNIQRVCKDSGLDPLETAAVLIRAMAEGINEGRRQYHEECDICEHTPCVCDGHTIRWCAICQREKIEDLLELHPLAPTEKLVCVDCMEEMP